MAPRKRRKKWSSEEDEELIAAVKRHGEGSWALIAKEEFEGERTPSQLSQRWGAIRRRCDTSNTSTQTGLQRTEAQMAANRALSLAVGNRVPAKKLAVGTPPLPSSGTITGAQANGANSGTLQSQQKSQPQVQALPRAATPAPTAKSRVPAKKTTTNSTSRAALVTANSVAAAACMSGLATAVSVPKTEPGKNAVSVLVPKVEPVKTSSTASLPRPSGISSALNAEPVKAASAASVPRPSGIISVPKAETVKTAASAASLLRLSGIIPAPKPEPVKTTTSAASRPSGIQSAPKAEPVKPAAPAASGPRPGMILAPNAEPLKPASAASLPRPPGIISAPKAEPVKAAPAASVPRPSNILSAPKADPVKSVSAIASNTKSFGTLNSRHAVNGSPNHTISSSPPNKPSLMAPLSKGSTIQNNSVPPSFASSRLVSTQRIPATTLMPPKPSVGAAVNTFAKPVGVQKEQSQGNRTSPLVTTTLPANKTFPTNSVISTSKVETPPSLMPKKNQVVDICTDKSSLDKPPEKESITTASTLVVATAESKSKDEASNRESQDVAAVTGTRQKEL